MSIPLLQTKLFAPLVPLEMVSRPRLVDRFEAGLHRKLTVLSAPAGFGKTTLLAEWAQRHREPSEVHLPVGWLFLDKDDNDPSRYWTYCIAALQTIYPDLGRSITAMIQSPQPSPVESFLTSMINEIARRAERLVLILDDYHVIENEAIHHAMSYLLEHMPRQMHLVISGRVEPPLPLALLRGRGQLNEFTATDLRFTFGETEAFFNDVMKLGVSKLGLKALENRTEGWVASMQMAAISMRGHDDIQKFIHSFSGSQRHVLDYLTEEVFSRQPVDVQSFLLETSILDQLSVALCNAVAKREDAAEKLHYLEGANLFLMPLDDERKWFRYHPLFADLLRKQLTRLHPDLPVQLHHRASEWFEREGLTAEAIEHAFAAQDLQRAARLIEAVAVPMITMESKVSTLLGWLTKLPHDLVDTRPWLCIALAAAYLAGGRLDEIEPLLRSAEERATAAGGDETAETIEDRARIRSVVMALRANTASVRGDIQRTPELCHEALKQLPEDETFARAPIALNLGVAYAMRGEMQTAGEYLNEAAALGQATGNPYLALIAMGCLAETQAKQGFLHQAAETNRHALRVGAEWGYGGEPLSATSYAHISLAQILYQWNDLDEAIRHMTLGIQLREQCGNALIVLLGYPGLLLLNEFQEETNSSTEPGDFGKRIVYAPYNALLSEMAAAWQARLSLAKGDLRTVERWAASRELDLGRKDAPDFWQEFSYLTLVRLGIAQGRIDETSGMLERLRQKAESESRIGSVIEILVLQSLAQQTRGESDLAVNTLSQALALAEPEGYVRMFVDEGEHMKELLTLAASRGIAPDYISRLLGSFEDLGWHTGDEDAGIDAQPSAVVPQRALTSQPSEVLSQRELEILRLMATGATSKEIARDLILSVGTVKKHIINIYRKLDVHKQTMAVNRARELGLL